MLLTDNSAAGRCCFWDTPAAGKLRPDVLAVVKAGAPCLAADRDWLRARQRTGCDCAYDVLAAMFLGWASIAACVEPANTLLVAKGLAMLCSDGNHSQTIYWTLMSECAS